MWGITERQAVVDEGMEVPAGDTLDSHQNIRNIFFGLLRWGYFSYFRRRAPSLDSARLDVRRGADLPRRTPALLGEGVEDRAADGGGVVLLELMGGT